MPFHLEIQTSLFSKRKTLDLAEKLDCEVGAAGGFRVALWAWAMDNLADDRGELPQMGVKSWAVVLKCKEDAGRVDQIRQAMIDVGIIDQVEPEPGLEWAGVILYIHDWHKAAGKLKVKQKNRAEYMRKWRAEKRLGNVRVTRDSRSNHVTPHKDKDKDKEKDTEKEKEKEIPESKSHSAEVPSSVKKKTQWSSQWLEPYQVLTKKAPPAGTSCKYLNKLAGTYTQLEVSTLLMELGANRRVFETTTHLNGYLNKTLQNRMAERVRNDNGKNQGRRFFQSSKQDEQWDEKFAD